MANDKLSDILAKHLVANVDIKNVYLDGNDPRFYADRMTRKTAAGAILLQQGMRLEALDCFRMACKERRDDFWARFYGGVIALEANDPASANYLFRDCLEEAPEDWLARPGLLTDYASCQFKLGDFEGAEASLDEAMAADPSLDRPYYMRAIHYIYQKDTVKALFYVKKGLAYVPDSKPLKHLEIDLLEVFENPEAGEKEDGGR